MTTSTDFAGRPLHLVRRGRRAFGQLGRRQHSGQSLRIAMRVADREHGFACVQLDNRWMFLPVATGLARGAVGCRISRADADVDLAEEPE